MAVTVGELAAALRLSADAYAIPPEPVNGILVRLLGVAEAFIELLIPNAPDAIKNECTVRFSAYLYDQPTTSRGDHYSNAWRNSGAGALSSRWQERRAGVQSGGIVE